MDVQVIHYQMDGLRFRILKGQLKNDLCELDRRAIRCGECEMAARLWLYRAENMALRRNPGGVTPFESLMRDDLDSEVAFG
jgi:hypothetical protein